MGFSLKEFWDMNPILFYLLVDQYNESNSPTSKRKQDKKIYYKEDL